MSNRNSLMAGAARFAHLAGLAGRPKAAGPEDNQGKKTEDDPEKKDPEASAEDGKDCPDCKGTGEDENGDECEACGGTGERDDATGAEDDDDETEMRGRSAPAQARRRERARCGAIFASPAAAANPVFAAHLAFDTGMTRKQALAALQASAAAGVVAPAQRPGATNRAARNPTITPGTPGGGAQREAGASWDRSFKKAGMTVLDHPLHRG